MSGRRTGERSAGEFELIERHLTNLGAEREDVLLGVGDDAAVLVPPVGAVLTTVMASASAKPGETPPALAARLVNDALGALASRHAEPAWATLALTLATADEDWVESFAGALDVAASEAGFAVVGGDTTRGPARVTLTLLGLRDAVPS